MTMWLAILGITITIWLISLSFISLRITKFLSKKFNKTKQLLLSFTISLSFTILITLCLDLVNAVICTIYFAMVLGVCDIIFWIIKKIFHLNYRHYYAGIFAIVFTTFILYFGWYSAHNVWQTNYTISTQKNMENLRIAMLSDAHLGTTFNSKEFEKHLGHIQSQNPDIIFIVGDYVDDSTSKADMIETTKALGKIKSKYGIYFVLGNHDKGYYGSAYRGFSGSDLLNELAKNGIKTLHDEVLLINNSFYIIGRKDLSEEYKSTRKSMSELTKELDNNKYIIVLDHQPSDFENQSLTKVDLVLSGHTHGGQLFPFNQVGKWIGANDLVYGHEKRNTTDFIVTSGISDWAIKFKTGTKSEFVIIDIK